MTDRFGGSFEGLPVLVTGHTGFKGSWLTAWLTELGAQVVGFSLVEPPTEPSNFEVSGLAGQITDLRGNVGDLEKLREIIKTYRPVVVFHLAAQAIVLRAYQQPKTTFDTNAAGTVNVLEAIRTTDSVRALVSITTDKVYRNEGWVWGYRENDTLGDVDPYGASKAMAELAIAAYRRSFFPREKHDEHGVAIASVRAGNVIGGGDFAEYRLVPDCMRSLMAGETILVRNPVSVRPWQHVLEPLSGYLALAVKLLDDGPDYAEAWNFGPAEREGVPAQTVTEKLIALWGSGSWNHTHQGPTDPETGYLRLSWDKAARRLGWRPVYNLDEALSEIVEWHRSLQARADMGRVCREHIHSYVERARQLGLSWAQ
jgi:CDP-glucose 4,6-dehydratase